MTRIGGVYESFVVVIHGTGLVNYVRLASQQAALVKQGAVGLQRDEVNQRV